MAAKSTFYFLVILCVVFTAFLCTASAENMPILVLYEGPTTMTSSQTASIWVDGNELFVYDVMVNHEHIWNANTIPSDTPMAYFDVEGQVKIEIEMPGLNKDIESAAVLPTSHGIIPTVRDNRVSFTISEPGFYTVVYNGHVNKATHIFANPLETDIPDKNDPNVLFIEPGHWRLDAIAVKSDQTLYISGGAVVNSVVIVDNAENVTIRGRGIIDGSDFPGHNQPGSYARVPIDIRNSKNITAEGFIIANANCWNFNSYASENAHISNVKIISGRQNGDGFTFQSCRNHTVVDSFARTWDDSLVLKNYSGSTRDITFERIQIWTDLAQSMEIGYETNKGLTINPEIYDVLFQDITVLYNNHKPVISIHNSDDAVVRNITYRNIVVENAFMRGDNGVNNELIEFHMNKSGWSAVRDEWGSIKDILIDGLTVVNTLDGRVPASRFTGHSEKHMIENVTIRNVTILGERITDLQSLRANANEFTRNITVESSVGQTTIVPTPQQTQAERPAIFPDPKEDWVQLPEGTNLALGKPASSGEVTEVYAAINVTDGAPTTYWESKGLPAEVIIDLEDTYTIQTVAVRLNPAPIWEPRTQSFEILVSADGESFVSVAPNTRYEFNSDSGNIVRVDFAPAPARFVKLIFTENSSGRSNGAQAAEVEIYE
ncbi:MAG: discoidin domain-containing protein [Clostridia bacterium]|nr:discoidin domain-containing protein [Clostridia bacterium]